MRTECHRQRRRGLSTLVALIGMVVLLGFMSLAIDFGRCQVARTELQQATDAAALNGTLGLADNTVFDRASAAAADNQVNGASLTLNRGDVKSGTWANGSFTVGGGGASPNAVRVRAQLSDDRGNAVKLWFGSLIGRSTVDIHADAVALLPPTSYGVIGLDFIKMSGNASTSYWAPSGTVTAGQHGSIASNGSISLSGSTMIYGDAQPGVGQNVVGGSGRVTGSTTALSAPLSFPNGDPGSYATVNDNNMVPEITGASDLKAGGGATVTIPGGNYYVHDVTLTGGSSMVCTGPVTIYCYHNFTLSGGAQAYGNQPKNLKIVMCVDPTGKPPGPVNLSGSSGVYASIYAPQSPVTLSGTGDIYGSVLGQSVNMTGSSNIHYDMSLAGGTGAASLVR